MTVRDLNGAWEEPGVIGTRVEIRGRDLVILWRSDPVLTTTFRVQETAEGLSLLPAATGMRYRGAAFDYATLSGLVYRDGALILTEYFPITGESSTTLKPTENTRFGRYAPDQKARALVQGDWRDENGFLEMSFRGDKVRFNGKVKRFVVLRPFDNGPLLVADRDPAVDGWDGMDRFEIRGDELVSSIMVCDAKPVPILLRRVH